MLAGRRRQDPRQPEIHRAHGLRPHPHQERQARPPQPPDQWLWTPKPSHPVIIDRPVWDAAQTAAAEHSTSTDTPRPQQLLPAARTVYPLRGIIRCHLCGRRLTGHRVTGRRGQITLYYVCGHN